MKQTTSKSGIITQVLLAAVGVAVGYLLLFSKTVEIGTLCQLLCGGLVTAGIISIVSFFLAGDYKRIDRYGFAIGVLLVMFGCIGFLRIDSLTSNFGIYMGMLSLILAVLTLQGTVQMKVLDYAVWILNLILTIVCLAGSFCVLAEIKAITDLVNGFSGWVLLINGICCLFSLIVTWICIILADKREKKALKEAQEMLAHPSQTPAQPAPVPNAESAAGSMSSGTAPSNDAYGTTDAQPAENHHTGFDASDSAPADLPPLEKPELTFEPSENHHAGFSPDETNADS